MIRKSYIIVVILLLFPFTTYGQSDIMIEELKKNKSTSLKSFVNNFPFKKYLKNIAFTDFKTLQNDRLLLWQEKGDGDVFLYHLGQNFMDDYPVYYSDLEKKISIGEAYLNPKKGGWNTNTDEIYKIIGYYILGKVARKIETGIRLKQLNSNRVEALVKKLERNKIYVSVEETKLKKIEKSIRKGDFGYIFNRLHLKLDELFAPLSCRIKIEGHVIIYIFIIILLITVLSRNIVMIVFLVILSVLIGVNFTLSKCSNNTQNTGVNTYKSKIKLNHISSYGGVNNNTINIYELKENGKVLGHSIWMDRPNVQANYIAHQNINVKLNNLKKKKKIVLATTGGYTNNKQQPEGLTIENGNIVNATIMHDRHGLVIVEKSGGIRILNLKKKRFLLPYGGPNINNPLNDLISFSELLAWSKKKKATLFQTHLLAFSDNVLISRTKAKTQIRERRLLVLVSDPKTKKNNHIIFNLESSFNLADITFEIYSIIKKRNKKIEGILNLDVGSYNIMHVYDMNGNIILKAPVSINNATNLLIYNIN